MAQWAKVCRTSLWTPVQVLRTQVERHIPATLVLSGRREAEPGDLLPCRSFQRKQCAVASGSVRDRVSENRHDGEQLA